MNIPLKSGRYKTSIEPPKPTKSILLVVGITRFMGILKTNLHLYLTPRLVRYKQYYP